MTHPLVSIIVPVFNAEKYLADCINSIVNQTYRNIEIILIDDGSSDSSLSVLYDYAATDNRIVVLSQENSGVSAARNVGLSVAKGDYIAFADADDLVSPMWIWIMVRNLMAYDADISICAVKRFSDGKIPEVDTVAEIETYDIAGLLRRMAVDRKAAGFPVNRLSKRKTVERVLFDTSLQICEDMDYTVQCAMQCKRAVVSTQELYFYRYNQNSVTADFGYTTRILSILDAYAKIVGYYKAACPELVPTMMRHHLKHHLNILGRLRLSDIKDETVEMRLRNSIRQLWPEVMSSHMSVGERVNLYVTRMAPALVLRGKRWLLSLRGNKNL